MWFNGCGWHTGDLRGTNVNSKLEERNMFKICVLHFYLGRLGEVDKFYSYQPNIRCDEWASIYLY